jgi:hypothetical protein
MGLIPNRKGQPLLIDWQAVLLKGGAWCLEDFAAFVARTELKATSFANQKRTFDTSGLQSKLPEAVDKMTHHMVASQQAFAAEMDKRLEGTLANLERLQHKQIEHLEHRLFEKQQIEQIRQARKEKGTQQIRRVFDEYRMWVQDTMTSEPQPFIQVLAAVAK